ncbi:NAD(P)-dependent oxidoreductase [Salinicoccus halitifaciens]|uniref:NADH-flavin reductase n=1 Tax=Salinicoccus halitifaciens TaxID=1073415 RepID=A0ABV2E9Z2_9STAP|nr:SDR family oxidoreductase [Salinicoccus halitifaciens]MCD2138010.1 SDR family oxidoreductase [Salinicoccus halitifaciens]
MKILTLGATGRTGSHILKSALGDGHHVTALVRDAEKIQVENSNLTVMEGNALSKSDIENAAAGMDVVISALGTDGTTTLSESMPFVIKAMEEAGIRRIITIGTAGILDSRTEPGKLRYQSNESRRRTTRAAKEHHKVYELLERSNLDWTIVCPTYLPDGEYTGEYRVERDFLPEEGKMISVPDTAEFAYSQIEDDRFIKSRVGIAY